MSLLPREAELSPGALSDEVPVAAPLGAHDITERNRPASVDRPVNEDGRRRRWRHLGAYIDRVRSDSLLRNSLFIMANTEVTSAAGYVFWLVAANMYGAPVNGLTSTMVSASAIIMLVSVAGVAGTFVQLLPGQSEKTEWSRTFWAGMATAVFFAMALCGIALMVLPFISPKLIVLRSADYAAVFAIGTIALPACLALDFVFIAERRAGYLFFRNLAAGTVKMLALWLLGLAAIPNAFHLLCAWGAESTFGVA